MAPTARCSALSDAAMTGTCLCGAVRVRAVAAGALSACHCRPCRRWSGSVFAGFDAEGVEIEGPVRTYRSSSFATRAWCEACGTHLWFRDDGGPFELSPGIFDEAGAWPLAREVYADRARAFALAGDHERVSAADYEAGHRHVQGDEA